MTKPVCVKCQKFFYPKMNGVVWEEGKPWSNGSEPHEENGWSSYKLWAADLWACPKCGHEIIVGHASRRFAEHYEPDYAEQRINYPPYVFVKDC